MAIWLLLKRSACVMKLWWIHASFSRFSGWMWSWLIYLFAFLDLTSYNAFCFACLSLCLLVHSFFYLLLLIHSILLYRHIGLIYLLKILPHYNSHSICLVFINSENSFSFILILIHTFIYSCKFFSLIISTHQVELALLPSILFLVRYFINSS